MSVFRVGMKVVCIHDDWDDEEVTNPVAARVYTIRNIELSHLGPFLRFEEIVNPVKHYQAGLVEASFDAECFRPVVERKTSIEVFQAMLTRPRVTVQA